MQEGLSIFLINFDSFLDILCQLDSIIVFLACLLVWEANILYILMKLLSLLVSNLYHL